MERLEMCAGGGSSQNGGLRLGGGALMPCFGPRELCARSRCTVGCLLGTAAHRHVLYLHYDYGGGVARWEVSLSLCTELCSLRPVPQYVLDAAVLSARRGSRTPLVRTRRRVRPSPARRAATASPWWAATVRKRGAVSRAPCPYSVDEFRYSATMVTDPDWCRRKFVPSMHLQARFVA